MILTSFGNVKPTSTTIGTIATINAPTVLNNQALDPTASYYCQAISFQVLGTNGGSVYICDTANPDMTTGIGVLWEIPAPANANSRPAWIVGDPSANNPINASQFYILPAVSGEGVRVGTYRTGTKQINWPVKS